MLDLTPSGSAVLSAVLLLAGCGQTPNPTDTDRATEAAQAPERRNILLATTTSTQDSGLLDLLLPLFEMRTGYRVKTIAVGTGEALAMGKRGDADVLLAHSPAQEKELVAAGFSADVQYCARLDVSSIVPLLRRDAGGLLTLAP